MDAVQAPPAAPQLRQSQGDLAQEVYDTLILMGQPPAHAFREARAVAREVRHA